MEQAFRRPVFRQPAEAEGFLAHGIHRGVGKGEVPVLNKKAENDQITTALIAFLLTIAIGGFVLVPLLTIQPNSPRFQLSIGHGLVGAVYVVICLLGVAAVFLPAKCRGFFQKTQNPLPQAGRDVKPMPIKGHHPDCRNFSGNRIVVRGQVFCAACSGLFAGAIIALVGTTLYFFVGMTVAFGSIWMIALGEIWMLIGLAQIRFADYAKAIANALFVVGSFIFLVETDRLGESVLLDFYVLGLIGFVLWLRILLSEWNNRRICNVCKNCFQ